MVHVPGHALSRILFLGWLRQRLFPLWCTSLRVKWLVLLVLWSGHNPASPCPRLQFARRVSAVAYNPANPGLGRRLLRYLSPFYFPICRAVLPLHSSFRLSWRLQFSASFCGWSLGDHLDAAFNSGQYAFQVVQLFLSEA